MIKRMKSMAAAGVLALAALFATANAARADYVYVPKTVYVTKYDCYGRPYRVCYTMYVRVWVCPGY